MPDDAVESPGSADTGGLRVAPWWCDVGHCCSTAAPARLSLSRDIENVRTDLISAAAASSNRATFFLSMTVPKAVGLTGTFVNIEAIQ
jgi:hypothetical protein